MIKRSSRSGARARQRAARTARARTPKVIHDCGSREKRREIMFYVAAQHAHASDGAPSGLCVSSGARLK